MMDLPANYIETTISRGVILHSTMFADIDHGKFFVVIGVSEEEVAGFFFINKPEQYAMQYPMRKCDYDFLCYDSFLCATRILKMPREKIAASIRDGVTTFIGNMIDEHLEELLESARDSRLFSKRDKQIFLY